jgi:glycosidase
MKFGKILLVLLILNLASYSQKVEPPFWWVGMTNPNLQLMVYKNNIANYSPSIDNKNVELVEVHLTENPNYVFIDITIKDNAKSGTFNIDFYKKNKKKWTYKYELKERRPNSALRKGFSSEDIMYLLMPDRFSNGNASNDNVDGMLEKANRSNPDGRHGGDIQGISNHLDYLHNLGVTALWINPLLENNMKDYSYHGYAITDYYNIDPRFGSNQDYIDMVQKAKAENIKVVMDMVFNHCGSNHWWMKDLPSNDWIHQFDKFTRSNYRGEALMDPHASKIDRELMHDGWFDSSMPDLNQKNPFLAKYLIQNSIWWIEYADLGGIRMDTYPYADYDFMTEWVSAVYKEYPNFNIVGEAWLQTISQTAYFQSTTFPNDKKASRLHSVTDFPLCYAANNSLNEEDSWTNGMAKLYMTLSQDFVYANADSNLIFLDNHDINRFATNIDSDFKKWKMGMVFLMTTRGIPMIYYGGEFMMTGDKSKGDANLRKDFPGGWKGDSVDVFSGVNMSKYQIESLEFTKKLFALRNSNKALQTGKLTQYIPQNNTYVYFRYNDTNCFMIVMNNGEKESTLNLSRFEESMSNYKSIKSFQQNGFDKIPPQLIIPAKSAMIYELK